MRSLPELSPGDAVIIQDGYCDTSQPWTVVQQYGHQVGITNGTRFLLLNRQHVREYLPPAAPVSREAVFIPDRCAMPIQSVSSLVKPSEPVKPVLSLVKPFEPVKPIPGLSLKQCESVTPSLSSTPSLPVKLVVVPSGLCFACCIRPSSA